MTQFYQPSSNQVFDEDDLHQLTGYFPETDPEVLASNGIFVIVPSSDPYDPALYISKTIYTIEGAYAYQGWEAVPLPLDVAKSNADAELKTKANEAVEREVTLSGFSVGLLVGVASQPTEVQPSVYKPCLSAMFSIAEKLNEDISLVESAETVDEINNILHPGKTS